MDWFLEFILGPGLKQICTALRFSQSLGLDFVMEMLLDSTEKTHCQCRTKAVLRARLYATLFSLTSSRSFTIHVFLYLLWPVISESLCCSVCGRLVMLPLCHGQQKERDMVRTCASPEQLTPSRVSEHVHPLHKHKQLQWLWIQS